MKNIYLISIFFSLLTKLKKPLIVCYDQFGVNCGGQMWGITGARSANKDFTGLCFVKEGC